MINVWRHPDAGAIGVVSNYKVKRPIGHLSTGGFMQNLRQRHLDGKASYDWVGNMTKANKMVILGNKLRGPILVYLYLGYMLSDGFYFVGMITPQYSPLQETVVSVFFMAIMFRWAQLIAAFFLSDTLDTDDAVMDDITKFIVLLCHLASLMFCISFFMSIFFSAGFISSMNANNIFTPAYSFLLSFGVLFLFLEVIRLAIIVMYIMKIYIVDNKHFYMIMVGVYGVDLVFRAISAVMLVPTTINYLTDQDKILINFLGLGYT